jgi:hypothetical protein
MLQAQRPKERSLNDNISIWFHPERAKLAALQLRDVRRIDLTLEDYQAAGMPP